MAALHLQRGAEGEAGDDENIQHDRGSAAGSRRQAGDVRQHGMGRAAQSRRLARSVAAPARLAAVAYGANAAGSTDTASTHAGPGTLGQRRDLPAQQGRAAGGVEGLRWWRLLPARL